MAGRRRFGFANDFQYFINRQTREFLALERRAAHQELVQDSAQRIDVRARVDIAIIEAGLFGGHVLECPDDGVKTGM